MYNKFMKTSNATNKTISKGKFHGIFWSAINAHWGLFWMGAELIKAVCVLVVCSQALFNRVGWYFLLLPGTIGAKILFGKYTRKYYERAGRGQHKIGDKRMNELESALDNVKVVKLYAWQQTFINRIQKWRSLEEGMRFGGELRNWSRHLFHHILGSMLKPAILTLAMYSGTEISMASIFTTLMMIDWLHWPMHMLPHFMENLRNTKRQMRRI